jgi:hypothetical protein
MIKYLVCPGWISSKTDRDEHYIDAPMLMKLYGVDSRECLIRPTGSALLGWQELTDLVRLEPRYHGDYSTSTDKGLSPRDDT